MKYLTTDEVAAELRVGADWVAAQCRAGNLKGTKLGTSWRISEASLAAFMSGPVPAARKRLSARQSRRSSARSG